MCVQRLEGGIGCPGTGVTDGCEPSLAAGSGPLEEHRFPIPLKDSSDDSNGF